MCLVDVTQHKFKPTAGRASLFCLLSLTVFANFFLVASIASAQGSISASEVSIRTPAYPPNLSDFKPELGVYNYRVGWQSIGAANLEVHVDRVGDLYHITSTARTNSIVDIFYKLRYRAEGLISAVNLRPQRTVIKQQENSRRKEFDISFQPSGVVRTERIDRRGKKEVEIFEPENMMLDPFSAAFLARSLDWQVGQTRYFDTFNGKSRYLISLSAVDKETRKIDGEQRELFVISPTVKTLTNPKAEQKLRSAKIYVTDDERRDIVEIESEVWIGSVRTELVGFKPKDSEANIGAAQMARLNVGE